MEASANPDLWRLTLEHSPIGMAMVGMDGRALMVNRALSEMLGYDGEELARRGFQEFTHPEDLGADLALFDRAILGEIDSYRLRKRYLHADGHVVWGDLSVALVRGADGRPLRLVSQVLDVTEQHEHEELLKAASAEVEHERQALEAIFETVSVGLLLIGSDGQYLRMNRRHQETMARPFPEGHGGAAGQLGHVYHPDGTRIAPEDMPSYRAMQGEEFDDYRYWVGDEPLTRTAFSTSARQVRGPSGERLGAALAYQEVTELMRAMQVKDEFVASVSHELRTPLTPVLGYLEMLCENDELSPPVVAQLRVVQRNATRLQALVSDLLQVGQIGEADLQLQRTGVDLVEVVRRATEASRHFAKMHGVTVRVDVPGEVPALVDGQRIRQVLDNLISNAVKYSHDGGSVTVRLEQTAVAVVLEVCDSGIGIAPADVDQVFDRFFRGGEAIRRHIPGTGVGLSIVSSIVAAHGGAVTVESELGAGSTFRVTLPHQPA